MTSAIIDPRINDEFTKLQLLLVKQKLQQEKGSLRREQTAIPITRWNSDPAMSTAVDDRLRNAMSRRQELLHRLRHEYRLNNDLSKSRPRSFRTRTPPRPNTRLSLPDINASRHVIEHQFVGPHQTSYVSPRRDHTVIQHQFAPAPVAPSLPVITAPYSYPVTPPAYPMPLPFPMNYDNRDGKNDDTLREWMMMQNSQMQQMLMQQWMFKSQEGKGRGLELHDLIQLYQLYNSRDSKKDSEPEHLYYLNGQPVPASMVQGGGMTSQPSFPFFPPANPGFPPITNGMFPGMFGQPPYGGFNPYGGMGGFGGYGGYGNGYGGYGYDNYDDYDDDYDDDDDDDDDEDESANREATPEEEPQEEEEKDTKPPEEKSSADAFLVSIQLKECVYALHNYYLNPNGKFAEPISKATATNANDFTKAFEDGNSKAKNKAMEDIAFMLEKFTFEITDIMPTSGVLGTHDKSFTFALTQPGRTFPRKPTPYFWQIERNILHLDANDRTETVSDAQVFYILASIFLGRGLISTALLRPAEYGLTEGKPTQLVAANLRVIGTLMMYLLRRLYKDQSSPTIPESPYEIRQLLFPDELMKHIYKKMEKILDQCEQSFRRWGDEFVKRLRAAAQK